MAYYFNRSINCFCDNNIRNSRDQLEGVWQTILAGLRDGFCRSRSRLGEARHQGVKGKGSAARSVAASCRASSPSLLDHDLQVARKASRPMSRIELVQRVDGFRQFVDHVAAVAHAAAEDHGLVVGDVRVHSVSPESESEHGPVRCFYCYQSMRTSPPSRVTAAQKTRVLIPGLIVRTLPSNSSVGRPDAKGVCGTALQASSGLGRTWKV